MTIKHLDSKWYHSPTGKDLSILIFVFLIFHIPFLDRALIIDDACYVDQALNIIKNLSGPYSFDIHLERIYDFFHYFANPPGFAYYLAAMIKLFGNSDFALHTVCLVFSALALISMYTLSRDIIGKGLWGALFLMSTPAFLLSSHTVMADIPSMAFYLLAVSLFVRGMAKQSLVLFVLTGMAAGISSLLKYSGLTVIPLMFLYWLLCRTKRLTPLLSLLIAVLIFGAWCFASYAMYGEVHFFSMMHYETVRMPIHEKFLQGISGLMGIGGATIFPIFLLVWSILSSFTLGRVAGWTAVIVASTGFLVALPAYAYPPIISYDFTNRILGAWLLSAGSSTFIFVIFCGVSSLRDYMRAINSKDRTELIASAKSLMLVCWFLGIFWFNLQLLFATPKYLIPALPALILLLLGATKRTETVFMTFVPGQKFAILAFTTVLSLFLCIADTAWGNSHRRFIIEILPLKYPGRQIWFNGHWPIRYYSEQMGFRYLGTKTNPASGPQKGDILFVVEESVRHIIPPTLAKKLKVVDVRTVFSPLPLQLTNMKIHAGYWAHILGVLPYVITNKPNSTIVTLKIQD